MIETISIRNIALIDALELELAPGLNIFTGETGAGKSVILRAIGLVLGQRSPADIVRSGSDSAFVEIGVMPPAPLPLWDTSTYTDACATADTKDTVILSRRITANGRNRCHINGRLVNLKQLQQLGNWLVDIHGQHEHQSLFRTETHLNLLDDFGGSSEARRHVSKLYQQLQTLQQEADNLTHQLKTSEREKDLLEFEIQELTEANLSEGEEEKLTAEARVLNNAEKLFEEATAAYAHIDGSKRGFIDVGTSSNSSALSQLRSSAKTLAKLCELDESLSGFSNRLDSTLYELEDIASHIQQYANTVEFNPTRLTEVTERLVLISKLRRRYGNTISEILAYQEEASRRLSDLQFGSEKIERLHTQIRETKSEAEQACIALSAKRKHVAERLSRLVERELRTLGMDKADFWVSVQPIQDAGGALQIDDERYAFSASGIDEVEFLISPNVGSEARPLVKIASGGEISRVMLALKTVLVQVDSIPTLLFDEIDSGIGGKVADVVGKKLKELAEFAQVICITHLPQIARFADRHFRVEKEVVGEETLITAKPLTAAERVTEIVRMHGGKETEIGLAHARELLDRT